MRVRDRDAGFTLVELLAVLAILGLLMTLATVAYTSAGRRARQAETIANMTELGNLLTAYQQNVGDFPRASLTGSIYKIKSPNDTNVGIEACVAALHHKKHPSLASLSEQILGNTDDDETSTDFHRSGSSRLLEVVDGWGNPIAYFDYKSYGAEQDYQMGETAPQAIQTATAILSDKTGVAGNADSYQLISAGVDQEFGTEDDLTNFDS